MYWFNSQQGRFLSIRAGLLFTALISACKPDIKETAGAMQYFDLKAYFKAESARLTQTHPLITKTAAQNGLAQTKKLYITNWGRELEPFINSDINKPAWRNSYSLQNGNGIKIYAALTPELRTQKIVIKEADGKVKWILISNHTKEKLYENTEELSYSPDLLYRIIKSQHVRLMGTNICSVKGVF